jgi:Arc/MetJ-type ribon-helix-helix transcriptional regulator
MHSRKVKLAVSMAPALLRQVKSQVELGRAKSVSAWVEHAVAAQLAAEADFDALLAEALAATGGTPTAAEKARARRLLRGRAA